MCNNTNRSRYGEDGLASSRRHMRREAHQINQGRYVNQPAANAKDTGNKTYHDANANTNGLAIG